jgi:hypothetical protein
VGKLDEQQETFIGVDAVGNRERRVGRASFGSSANSYEPAEIDSYPAVFLNDQQFGAVGSRDPSQTSQALPDIAAQPKSASVR